MGQLVELTFEGAMVPLNLAIGLRMEGRGGNMLYTHQSQVLVELMGNVIKTRVNNLRLPKKACSINVL